MGKMFNDLKRGDKIYFFYSDKIHEYVVENTERNPEKYHDNSYIKEQNIFRIHTKELSGYLTFPYGQEFSDVMFTSVVSEEGGYVLGVYATSIEAIGEVLEKQYEEAIANKERTIKCADEAIMRAKKQKEEFKKIRKII